MDPRHYSNLFVLQCTSEVKPTQNLHVNADTTFEFTKCKSVDI